jgi:molybdopterin converting factor small subunit
VIVFVHLHTTLQIETPEGLVRNLSIEIDDGARLIDLVDILGIEADEAHTLFVVQGQIADLDHRLAEGDVVHFIPAISGGNFSAEPKKYTL